jgi:hypothetical protein
MAHANNQGSVLPLHCPKCAHDGATVFVSSYTVVTLVCATCRHTWSAEVAALPDAVRKRLALAERRPA